MTARAAALPGAAALASFVRRRRMAAGRMMAPGFLLPDLLPEPVRRKEKRK